jgi:hypothetical protein
MMRFVSLAILASVALGACASGGSGGAPVGSPSTQTIAVVGPSGGAKISTPGEISSNTQTLPFSVDQVWRALPATFDTLGIPVQALDNVKHTIGNSGFAIRRRLKNVPLSRYIDCGNSQLGPSADDYDVRLTVLTDVKATDGGAVVTTSVQAVARPMNYAQEYSSCNTRGSLEQRIIDVLRGRLAR